MAPPPFDWSKLTSKENLQKTLGAAAAVVVLLVVLRGLIPDNSILARGNPTNLFASNPGAAGERTWAANRDGGTGPVPLSPLAGGQCRGFAPEGWMVTDANGDGTVMTAQSPDRAMTAAYAADGINAAQQQWGNVTTESLLQTSVNALAGEQLQMQPQGNLAEWTIVRLQGAGHAGYALMYQMGVAGGGFVMIARIAIAAGNDPRAIQTAGSVAASIRCTAQYHISSNTDRGGGRGTGTSKACRENGSCDDSDLAGTYNAQLGTGWVHDTLGRNYNVSVTSDYDDNGPDGPGYYAMVGGTREKLQPGLQ